MPNLCIYLFGRFNVQYSDLPVRRFDQYKVQELFCYLLLHRDRPQHRETLAGILWNQASTAQSKASLRKTLWQLQTTLESCDDLSRAAVLLVDSDWIQINPRADFWLDVACLEQAFTLVSDIPGAELSEQHAQVAEEATRLYHGDLLDGWYQDWCLYERERLQNIYLLLLHKLMGYCEANQAYEQGLAYGTEILRYDDACEQTHRGLMRLYFLAGDRTAALRQYKRCTEILDKEFGVKPTELTSSLHDQIKRNCLDDSADRASFCLSGSTMPIMRLLSRLRQLQNALSMIENQVQQDIHAVEQVLRNLK